MSEVRVCAVLLFVFVYTISLSNSADAGDKQMNDAVAGFFHNGALTEKQKNSTVTIEFNCTAVNIKKNRTNVDSMYRNVHEAILERLNRMKSNMATITPSTANPTSTTPSPTTIATPDQRHTPSPNKKKRKKREKSSAEYDAKDLRFVKIDPEFDENEILAMSLLLVGKESDDRDCGMILFDAANQTNENGTLVKVAGVPVIVIYRGLPPNRRAVTMTMQNNYNHHYLIWPLVILGVIVLFIVIGGVIYWKKQQDKLEVSSQRK